jgi:murein L,D-transpeptidase YafK
MGVKNICDFFSFTDQIAEDRIQSYGFCMKLHRWMIVPAIALGYLAIRYHKSIRNMFVESLHPLITSQGGCTSATGVERAKAAAERVKPQLLPDLAAKGLHWGDPVFLRAFKEEKQLELYVRHRETKRFVLFRTYPIAALSGDLGPKCREGDGQVPEGFYAAGKTSLKPDSRFHLAFNIGYPNAYDRAHQRTGSFIMIHGSDVSVGCLAMTDEKIEEIYSLCDASLKNDPSFFQIHLFPFRMTSERMERESASPHHAFWQNLREGYQWFETQGVPPEAKVANQRYHFRSGESSSTETR